MDGTYYQGAAVAILVLNSLSFLSLLFVIAIYIARWKQIASFPMRISFYLCISCLIQNLYVLIYPPMLIWEAQQSGKDTSPYCIFQSMIKTAFDLSSIIWTLVIMYCSYATVVHGYTLERLELFYLCVGYLLPILLAIVPIFLGDYGYNIYFCWFDSRTQVTQFGLKLGYFFVPLWVFFFLEMYWAYRAYKKLEEVGLEGRQLKIFKKILLFPIILLITGSFATANLIYNYVNQNSSEWLDILSTILLSTYGVFISLAYGFNPLIQDQMKTIFGFSPVSAIRNSFEQSQRSSSNKTQKLAELINM